jgi:hypothetical protein
MKKNLQVLVRDGFNFNELRSLEIDLALISLKIALKAYFSTYQTSRFFLHSIDPSKNQNRDAIDANHGIEYCEACAECIVHFQHFAELVCKSFLREDHKLLAVSLTNPEILHKLIHNDALTPEDENQIRSIEFSEALARIRSLIKVDRLKCQSSLQFIEEHHSTLFELNKLRNRIWHRGLFILRYNSLDEFVGGYVLPFVLDVLKHPSYSGNEIFWKYNSLSCKIDPINRIVEEIDKHQYDLGKIAFLKELGRAAFENPLDEQNSELNHFKSISDYFDDKHRLRAERIADLEAAQDYSDIKACPVCGVKSLIIYQSDDIISINEDGEPSMTGLFTHLVKCENCSFCLEGGGIENASHYKFDNIDDYYL